MSTGVVYINIIYITQIVYETLANTFLKNAKYWLSILLTHKRHNKSFRGFFSRECSYLDSSVNAFIDFASLPKVKFLSILSTKSSRQHK